MSAKNRPPNAGKGRIKGVPNKATRDVREAIALLLQTNVDNFSVWLARVADGVHVKKKNGKKRETVWIAKPDPAKALDLALTMAEYHIPKLARTEHVGDPTHPIEHNHAVDPRALQAIAELLSRVTATRANEAAAAADSNGSVLPAPLRDGPS